MSPAPSCWWSLSVVREYETEVYIDDMWGGVCNRVGYFQDTNTSDMATSRSVIHIENVSTSCRAQLYLDSEKTEDIWEYI